MIALLATVPTAQAAWAVVQPPGKEQAFYDRLTLPEYARQTALDACNAAFSNCKTVITGRDGCVAIASSGQKTGVAKAGTQPRADAAALKVCEALGTGPCRIETQFCGR